MSRDVSFRGTAETIARQMLGVFVDESLTELESFRSPSQVSRLVGIMWMHWQRYVPESVGWRARGTPEASAQASTQATAFRELASKIRGLEIHLPAGVEPEKVSELCDDLAWDIEMAAPP